MSLKILRRLTVALFVASPALAVGPGVRAGDFELHVGGEAAVNHDDNFFRKSEASVVGTPDAITTLGAGFKLTAENRSPNKLLLRLRGDVDFRKTLGADEETRAAERDGISGVDQSLLLGLFPKGSFSLDLNEKVQFRDAPAEPGAEDGFERFVFDVGPDLRFRPGGGASRAFELRLGYRFKGTRFFNDGGDNLEADRHQVRFLTEWKFFPKTAAFADVRYSVIDRPAQDAELHPATGAQFPERNLDSNPFRLELGLKGLITQRLSAVLRGGFLHTFNAELDSFVGGVGQLKLEYIIEPTLQIEAGYEFDARSTAVSNFYKLHNVFARIELFLLSRLEVGGKVAYQIYDFTASNARYGLKRDDPLLRATVEVKYNFVEWLSAGVTWRLEKNSTDYKLPISFVASDGTETALEEPRDFSQQIVSFVLTADY